MVLIVLHYHFVFDSSFFYGRVEVAAAPYGGPIALLSRPPLPAKPHIDIYNCAGHQVGLIKWNSGNSMSQDFMQALLPLSTDLYCLRIVF